MLTTKSLIPVFATNQTRECIVILLQTPKKTHSPGG